MSCSRRASEHPTSAPKSTQAMVTRDAVISEVGDRLDDDLLHLSEIGSGDLAANQELTDEHLEYLKTAATFDSEIDTEKHAIETLLDKFLSTITITEEKKNAVIRCWDHAIKVICEKLESFESLLWTLFKTKDADVSILTPYVNKYHPEFQNCEEKIDTANEIMEFAEAVKGCVERDGSPEGLKLIENVKPHSKPPKNP